MKTTKQNNITNNRKLIITIVLSVIVILAIIVALIFHFTGKNKIDNAKNTAESVSIDDGSDAKTLAIEQLISQYRLAFATADINALKNIYNTDEIMNANIIIETAKIITGYENTKCYIKDGLDSNSNVVFVYNDLKIDGLASLVPDITYLYVKKEESLGSYYIYPGEYDSATESYIYSSEVQKYISDLIKDADIKELYATVNEKIAVLCEEDNDVKAFISKLQNANSKDESNQSNTGTSTESTDAANETDSETASSETAEQ